MAGDERNGNGKVRVVVFEVEGSDATIQGVVDAAVRMAGGPRAEAAVVVAPVAAIAAPAAPPAVAVVEKPRRTPKPVKQAVAKPVKQAAAKRAEREEVEKPAEEKPTLAEAIRRLLAKGSMTDTEIKAAAKPLVGFEPTSQQIYATTYALRRNNEIVRDNPTGGWMLTGE